ncbi:MAG: hypothetical protein HPY54_08920 [Chthonomonadetes bacterium]|nr:hypothetical protein [Chthonomonadetes bacterium]
MYRLKSILLERETLLTIGIFGLAQMVADLFSDAGYSAGAMITRLAGIALVLAVLVASWLRKPSSLSVPLLLIEENKKEDARARYHAFVKQIGLGSSVREIGRVSPVREEELYIRMTPTIRDTSAPEKWHEEFLRLIREWDEEVDERLYRWYPDYHSGLVYHLRPMVVLPMAFALGATVGLRRSVVLYHSSPQGSAYRVMDLREPRRVLEPPDQECPLQQIPEEIKPPEEKQRQLILHIVLSDHHFPDLSAHVEHQSAVNLALYYNQRLPDSGEWLPYVQTVWQRVKPWIHAFQRVDICLICPDAVAFALGMAFSGNPHIRVCHRIGTQYVPVVHLEWLKEYLAFT